MFNRKTFLALGAAAMMTASVTAATTTTAPGNRVFYAFTLGSSEFTGNDYGYDFGFVEYPFDPTASDVIITGKMLDSYLETLYKGVYAAAGVDGLIYAAEYEVSGDMAQPVPRDFVVYNTFNGLREVVGQWNKLGDDFKVNDMTWSEKDQKMYAIGYGAGKAGLYTIDLETADFTLVCTPANGGGTLAAAPDGTLYTLSSSGTLYTLDPATGRTVKVMDTKLSGMLNHQSMEFDKASGLLYWLSNTVSHPLGYEDSWMQEIDVKKRTIREIGQVGGSARYVGLHIPSCERLGAPAAATNVTSTPDANGKLEATISWTNPTTAFNGDEIGTLYGYKVYRDGEVVYTSDGSTTYTPGATESWTDTTIPSNGNFRYDVVFYNGQGDGAKGTVFQFIGPDSPGFVSHIKGEVADGAKAVTLKWDAPAAGRHLGFYDPAATRYKVVRNDGVLIADNLTECEATDSKFARTMQYTYTVCAYNEQGSSELVSPAFILGPAFKMPWEFTFEDDTKTLNLWTPVDPKMDGYSWLFNSTLGQTAFYDFEAAVEYIVSPGLGNSGTKADEWLISPPVKVEAGIEYEITVSSRSYTKDQYEIWMGRNNTVEGMTEKIGEFSIDHDPYTNPDLDPITGTIAFRRRSAAIPVQEEDADKCFAIHLVTDCTDLTHAYFQINAIYFGEKGEYSGIENAIADAADATFSISGKTLTIFGNFTNAEIFDLSGRRVLATSAPVADLSALPSGVYILAIDGKSHKLAL